MSEYRAMMRRVAMGVAVTNASSPAPRPPLPGNEQRRRPSPRRAKPL